MTAALRSAFVAEHGRIMTLLEAVIVALEAGDDEAADADWRGFRALLLAHLGAEDAHLLPAIARAYPMHARVLGREHQYLREQVAALEAARGPTRAARARTLVDILRAHARTEDRLLYDPLEVQLSESERAKAIADLQHRLDAAAE